MPPINLLIKPASSKCNMRCKYCFYFSIAENRSAADLGIMSEETLEQLIKKGIAYADHVCSFAFQGGEPTIAGLEFYEKVIFYQKKYQDLYQKNNLQINNAIQTNGYLIDEKWTSFFHQHNFLVGLSLDGPPNVHDKNRIDAGGSSTFSRLMKAVELFEQYRVEYNILSVVTGQNAQSVKRIYRFFTKNKFQYLQFIPCLEPLEKERGSEGYHLSVQEYGDFLLNIFDLWFQDFKLGQYTSIRHIDNLVHMLAGERPEACNMNGICSIQFVVEGDGSVYPCDFYVYDQWKLGNVNDQSLQEMEESELAKRFVRESVGLPEECRQCRYLRICRNGCKRERTESVDGGPMKNYYCKAFYRFYSEREEALNEVMRLLKQRRMV